VKVLPTVKETGRSYLWRLFPVSFKYELGNEFEKVS